jgi:hypothetical protein
MTTKGSNKKVVQTKPASPHRGRQARDAKPRIGLDGQGAYERTDQVLRESLHPSDYAFARRWLAEAGEARFLRIARAASASRKMGRPRAIRFWSGLADQVVAVGGFSIQAVVRSRSERPQMSLMTGDGGSLWHALASMPDHRRAEGKRYPLASLLLIAGAAMLSGRRDQLGIVRWGRRLSRDTLASIGIRRARVPAPSVWCEMFKALDVAALERALGHWVRGGQPAGHVALDGKRLRGSATAQAAGVHLLAAFSASLQGVIGQLAVAPEANEITAALHLLKTLPLRGAVITGDAMFTQTEICRTIIDGGGDYFLTVKDNQPTLKADIALAFGPDSPLCRMDAAA